MNLRNLFAAILRGGVMAQASIRTIASQRQTDRRVGTSMSNIGMEQHERPIFEYQDKDDADGPSFWWNNPWTGQREKIANLWWPAHPEEKTELIEHMFENLTLQYRPKDEPI